MVFAIPSILVLIAFLVALILQNADFIRARLHVDLSATALPHLILKGGSTAFIAVTFSIIMLRLESFSWSHGLLIVGYFIAVAADIIINFSFLGGMAAFALAYTSLTLGLVGSHEALGISLVVGKIVISGLLAIGFASGVLAWLYRKIAVKYRFPSTLYLIAVLLPLSSIGLYYAITKTSVVVGLGAIMLFVSDIAIIYNKYVKPLKQSVLIILGTYWLGLIGISTISFLLQ